LYIGWCEYAEFEGGDAFVGWDLGCCGGWEGWHLDCDLEESGEEEEGER